MRRSLLLLFVLSAMLAAAAPAGAQRFPVVSIPPPAPAVSQVTPGISYERRIEDGSVAHVVRSQPSGLIGLTPILAGGATSRRGGLAEALAARSSAGATVAVNGDFFNVAASYPSGITVTPGEGLASEPEPSRSALLVGPDGLLAAAQMTLVGRWQVIDGGGGPIGVLRAFGGINRPAERSSEVIVYTEAFGPQTPRADGRREAVIALEGGARLLPNTSIAGTVTEVGLGGGSALAPGRLVITGVGSSGANVGRDLPVGTRVRIDPGISGFPPQQSLAVGGGPLLVDAGAPVTGAGEAFSSSQLGQRTSRTAIGQAGDGGYLLVSVEGPAQGSRGVTVSEQARMMARLGARLAVAMDAGGSAQMVVDGSQAVPWSGPRALTTAVVMRYGGVRIAPVAGRLTPNGDGLDDSTAAQVTAPAAGRLVVSLSRRGGGERRELLAERVEPGTRAVLIDPAALGIPDGPYELTAELTPDQGAATTMTRPVIVDRTLAALRVRAARKRVGKRTQPTVRVAFRLLRPARVSVRILDANGQPRRTVRSGRRYAAGTVLVVWDRRIGKAIAVGDHRIEVQANTSLGRPALATTIRLARVAPPKRLPRTP